LGSVLIFRASYSDQRRQDAECRIQYPVTHQKYAHHPGEAYAPQRIGMSRFQVCLGL
jgi:hypothetical protein